jgi:hypothetical protein
VGSTLPVNAAQKILLALLRGCGRTPRQARFAKFSHQQKKRPGKQPGRKLRRGGRRARRSLG